MNLTLKDLRVETPAFAESQRTTAGVHNRPASLADLVEVLKQEGAEMIWFCEWRYTPSTQERCEQGQPSVHKKCGRRLVLPLGDTPKRPDLLDNDPPEGEVFSWYT